MAAFDTRSDAELLTATALEPESFGIFYRRHVGQVLAYTLTRTRRPELAADLTAEVFAPAPAPLTPARAGRPGPPGPHPREAAMPRIPSVRARTEQPFAWGC